MKNNNIYLDYAATTPLCEKAKSAISETLDIYANPSSTHSAGMKARELIDDARATVAKAMKAPSDRVFFTSSGSEGNNTAILGTAKLKQRTCNKIISTDSEHPSVENALKLLEKEGSNVVRLKTLQGRLDVEELENALDEKTALVTIMHVNNETGAIYDIESVRKAMIKKGSNALLHCDNVQGFLKCDEITHLCDMVTVSAHKVNGPKGVGALYVKKGINLPPLIVGGGQENGMRSGTENLLGIVSFAAAVKERAKNDGVIVKHLYDHLRRKLAEIDGVTQNIPKTATPHILSISLGGVRSEVALNYLSANGIYLSAGSACSSKHRDNRVLEAFGVDRLSVESSLRISLDANTTVDELDAFVSNLRIIKEKYGKMIKRR